MEVSLFENFTSKRLESITAAYRQTHSKSIKTESPLFAVACRFEAGKGKENVRALTGLSLVDFDHLTPDGDTHTAERIAQLKAKIVADPHTLMCYTTISGNGLRVIFRYNLPDTDNPDAYYYRQAFFCGNAHYERLTGCKADMQCKNITRLSGLAHDPEVFLRPLDEAKPFAVDEVVDTAASIAKEKRESRLMTRIDNFYNKLVAPQLKKDGIVFASGSHNDYVMRVGYRLAEKRMPKKAALDWAVAKFGKDYPDTEQVVKSCFANASVHKSTASDKGDRMATVDDIKDFLDGCVKLRLNEITSRVEYMYSQEAQEQSHQPCSDCITPGVWLPINDRIVNSLWSQMSAFTRVNIQDMFRVIESDYVPSYNPFKAYLDELCTDASTPPGSAKTTDYIRQLARSVRVRGGKKEQERWYRYLKKWLVGMVAAWISDDVVNNVILVLIGEQGSFKTTWFNHLLPPELKRYFYTKTNANRMSKDDLLTLAQYGLVCCEELDTMRPAELNQLKAAVTMTTIDERAAYARYHEHRKHIASFCGTGNNIQFLSDPSGNRRWLPFEVECIRSPREHPFDYRGIYTQALQLYRSGFRFWFERDEIQELNKHNSQFETPHLEHELVDLYFRKPVGDETGEFVTVARALQIVSCGISQKLSSVNIGKAFVDQGFKRVRNNHSRGFIAVCRTGDEIKDYQRRMSMNATEEDCEESDR